MLGFRDSPPQELLNAGDELTVNEDSGLRLMVFNQQGAYLGGSHPWARCPYLPKEIAGLVDEAPST